MIACLFIYFRNGKCLTNEFFKGCGKEIQFTLSTENIIYITTIMAFWASMHRQRNSVFLLPTVITVLDGSEEVKQWLACVAGGNVQSRKFLEENAAKTSENGEEMPPKLSRAKTILPARHTSLWFLNHIFNKIVVYDWQLAVALIIVI